MNVQRTSNVEAQYNSDYSAVMRHCGNKGYQMIALVSPPVLLLLSLRRRQFSPTAYLRSVGLTTWLGGSALGLAAGAGRMSGLTPEQIHDRGVRVRSNRSQTRVDDWGVIGGVLGALGTTTIFLRRVSLLWTISGGAALGVAGGVITHIVKAYGEGENLNPEMMIDEAKDAVKKGGQ